MPAPALADTAFELDRPRLERALRIRVFELHTGVWVSAPFDEIDRSVQLEGDSLHVDGRIVSERLRTRLVAEIVREELTIERNARIHRIGNLTLTTLPLNQALSNQAWPKKRGELNKGSKLQLNTELLDTHPAVFDEAAIDQRTGVLASRICAIWPGQKRASN